MPHTTITNTSDEHNSNRIAHNIAIALSTIALLVSIAAYIRADEELQFNVDQQWSEFTNSSERQMAELSARIRLERLRDERELNREIPNAEYQVQEVRRDLEIVYETLSAETDTLLADLEEELMANSAEALTTIERLLTDLREHMDSESGN